MSALLHLALIGIAWGGGLELQHPDRLDLPGIFADPSPVPADAAEWARLEPVARELADLPGSPELGEERTPLPPPEAEPIVSVARYLRAPRIHHKQPSPELHVSSSPEQAAAAVLAWDRVAHAPAGDGRINLDLTKSPTRIVQAHDRVWILSGACWMPEVQFDAVAQLLGVLVGAPGALIRCACGGHCVLEVPRGSAPAQGPATP